MTETNDRPLGPTVDPHPAKRPERMTLPGRWITLTPLDAETHAAALYEGSHGDAKRESVWDYLFDGPYRSLDEFQKSLAVKAQSADPLFFAVLDNASGRALGYQTFLRIDPPNRVIEVGNIMYTPIMQRTPGATEAQFLFASYVFDTLGNRRYEWKCNDLNAPSKRAAMRLGFTFEGVFRQHMTVKGRNRDTAWFAMLDREWPAIKRAYRSWLSPENFDRDGAQKRRLADFMAEAQV
ncbi:MAG TPA: GNAT family protein [Roseiarcus sp.]|nr:GNAT family protein [Roseiarcus sp.]